MEIETHFLEALQFTLVYKNIRLSVQIERASVWLS
jgi:hypothetical protein